MHTRAHIQAVKLLMRKRMFMGLWSWDHYRRYLITTVQLRAMCMHSMHVRWGLPVCSCPFNARKSLCGDVYMGGYM